MRLAVLAVLAATAVVAAQTAPLPVPQTRPERTGWRETSTNADVAAFLRSLADLPHGARVRILAPIGATVQGRPIECVAATAGGGKAPRLRALIIADIHGGEVEGKESVQMLLREIALGEHADLLGDVDLRFVPVFNPDGNDEIDRGNRVEQNGPDGGVGRRHNSQDRDLNRDFVKAETPEVRALLRLFASFAPHLFMDLHTTNGSHHGYHLTYCTSLNANTDPDLSALMHERFLPAVRARMHEGHGLRIFDYGNFDRGGPERGWTTFSSDPRLAINYAGLRHCLSLLSEAYSYLPFAERERATRAFVLESLRELVARADEVLALRARAEARGAALPFRFDHELGPPVPGELLVGAVDEVAVEGLGRRLVAKPEYRAVQAPLRTRFLAKGERPLPAGWAILGDFPLAAQVVLAHGLPAFRLREATGAAGEAFAVEALARQRAPFQGHQLVQVGGRLVPVERELPAGTVIVPGGHPLARLAAQLLEADSDDGLATWDFFGEALARAEPGDTDPRGYPVLRLAALPAGAVLQPLQPDERAFRRLVPYLPLAEAPGAALPELRIEVTAAGRRLPGRGFEAEPRSEGRSLRYALGESAAADLAGLVADLGERAAPDGLVLRPARGVAHREVVAACEALARAGIPRVYLAPAD